MSDTIFALSSGLPPAAIALVRISGPGAGAALAALAGRLPRPRHAVLAELRDPDDRLLLDRAFVLWLPGPSTATGEDVAELHLHGGRAVVAAVERALERLPGTRRADAGEFTRRAFAHGRIDLAEAEGLADLLFAETELQRQAALAMASGELSRAAGAWRERLLALSAAVEAVLDFSDEDGAGDLPDTFAADAHDLAGSLEEWLTRPRAEVLREGFRVVLSGPPNSGKSTLFNALTESEAAITSPHPGTTRDVITRAIAITGVPLLFVDTAGLRGDAEDAVEGIGIERAHEAVASADLVLWLGEEGAAPRGATVWEIDARIDVADRVPKRASDHAVSALTGEGLAGLREAIVVQAREQLPAPGLSALSERQRRFVGACHDGAIAACAEADPLLIAEGLRRARLALDRLVGRSGTDDMLDSLFGRFCIGK